MGIILMGNVKDKLILGRIKHRMQGNNRLHYQYELDTSTFFPCLPPFEGLQISFYDHWGVQAVCQYRQASIFQA